ncbi:MAG: hypothetical protein ACRCSQ_05080 [Bacteroidales bacterium]
MKKITTFTFTGLLIAGSMISCKNKTPKQENVVEAEIKKEITTPAPVNPHLAPGDYAMPNYNPALTNTFSNSVVTEDYQVYSGILQEVLPAMLSGMALNSTTENYCWVAGANEIYYVSTADARFLPMARISLSGKDDEERQQNALRLFSEKNYLTGDSLKGAASIAFGSMADQPMPTNKFSLVDKSNTLYTIYKGKLIAVALMDQANPAKGIEIKKQLDLKNIIPKDDAPLGLQMLYDGNLILNSKQGHFCIVNRDSLTLKNQLQIIPVQKFFGPVAIDEKNGIYALSDSLMMKLTWNGTNLSCNPADGAWNYPITFDRDSALLAKGGGTLASPTLMGFGSDPDKLVVVADGGKRANLLAFWRDEIPADSTVKSKDRLAGKIPVNCGNYSGNDTNYLQSYHILPVWGYGTVFVNTINGYPTPTTPADFALLGSIIPCPKGIERFEWDYKKHRWLSVWSEPTISSSGMAPAISSSARVVLLNSFDSTNAVVGWNIKGFDWMNGTIVNQIVFSSNTQYGNGMNSFMQFMKDGDMLFNSIGGTYRISFGDDHGINKAPRL